MVVTKKKPKHKYVNLEMLNTDSCFMYQGEQKSPQSINFQTKKKRNWFQFLVDKFIIPNVTSTCFNLKVVS